MADLSTQNHVCSFPNCNKAFNRASRLDIHARSHTGERPFLCSVAGCERWFKRIDHVRRHENLVHGTSTSGSASPLTYMCEEEDCDAVFQSRQSLKKHEKRAHGQDSYKCRFHGCGQVFKKHHQLTTHRVNQHAELAPYRCMEPGCDKSFPTPSKLKRHSKTHEGYKCTEPDCTAHFDKWSLLVTHRRIAHLPVFKCPVCEKKFGQKQRMKRHSLIHEDSRTAFTCPHEDCGRDYLDKRNLMCHIRTYHDGQRFKCSVDGCGQTFSTNQKCKDHEKLHDPSRPPPKKKPKRKKTATEHLTEVRPESSESILASPEPEDIIQLPDLPNIEEKERPLYISHQRSEPKIITQLRQELEKVRSSCNVGEAMDTDSSEDGSEDIEAAVSIEFEASKCVLQHETQAMLSTSKTAEESTAIEG